MACYKQLIGKASPAQEGRRVWTAALTGRSRSRRAWCSGESEHGSIEVVPCSAVTAVKVYGRWRDGAPAAVAAHPPSPLLLLVGIWGHKTNFFSP